MIGHLSVPALDDSKFPASLSLKIITNLLREKLNFKGIIVTDALDMKSITQNFSPSEVGEQAIRAGANILLLPQDVKELLDSLEKISRNDTEFKSLIQKSAELIIKEKKWCSITDSTFSINDIKKPKFDLHEKLALSIAYSAVEIVGDKELLPLEENKNIAGFAFMQDEDLEPGIFFFRMLGQAIENDCDFAFLDDNMSDNEIDSMIEQIKSAEILIFAFFYRAKAYKSNINASQRIKEIVNKLSYNRPILAVILGNPYLKEEISANTYILTYSDSLPSIASAILALSGRNLENYLSE